MLELSTILWISVFMQCLAVILALRLIPETGRALAWIFLSVAFLLMATRRALSLLHQEGYFENSWLLTFSTEIVALIISIFIVTGVYMIRRIFEQQKKDATQLNKLSLAIEQNPGITIILDTEGKIEYVNPAFTRTTGHKLDTVLGKDPDILKSEYTDELTLKRLWDTIKAGGVWRGVVRNQTKDGGLSWERACISPVVCENEKITHYVAVLEDITKEKEQTEAFEYMAMHDALTNLPNRTLFFSRLEQAIITAKSEEKSLAVMLMDLDDFKEINDSLGHHVGDRVLREIGVRLCEVIRGVDTVARMGGDEFLVLLPSADEQQCITFMNRIIQTLKRPFALENLSVELGVSIGLSLYPEDGDNADLLLQHADVAMYSAKQSAESYVRYNKTLGEGILNRLELASDLRAAIEENQFLLQYQPLLNIKTGNADKVEVLLRWQHPERGLLYPDAFISLAEQTGHMSKTTTWVINNAFQQLSRWKTDGLDLGMSINVSVIDLFDLGLPKLIKRNSTYFDVEPYRITLEITESVLMMYTQKSFDVLTTLQNIGVQISIDDFGTGYSSLQHLKELPVAELKIDKSFVMDMINDEGDAIIVRSTIDLAHNLGLSVVAEGIESQDIFDILEILGCDYGQGFHIAKPMGAKQLAAWLESPSEICKRKRA
ncbi:MAG: putative bifunctional diguanylate cyclase/phosphodiesterase [Arenicellales bacterium]